MGICALNIENFRGIKSMTCENLSPITLIGGRNNSGKTSLLEAIKLLASRRDASTGADLNGFVRRIWLRKKEDLKTLFNDPELPFTVKGQMGNGLKCSLSVGLEKRLRGELSRSEDSDLDAAGRLGWELHHYAEDVAEDGAVVRRNSHLEPRLKEQNEVGFAYVSADSNVAYDWKCMFLSGSVRSGESDNSIFSKMTVALQDKQLSQSISRIYPEIYTVKLVNDQMMVKVRGYDNLLPAKVAGDGVTRIISVLCSLWNCKDGCLCVDEIDNGLHYSVLLKFWNVVADFVDQYNVQLLATTHHLDLLETLSKMAKQTGREDRVCYLRLAIDEDCTHVVSRFSGQDLDRALKFGFEVRG